MTSMVALEGLTYRYPGADAPALRDVTLEIEPGELVLLAGASGSGKSTLLRTVCGLVPHVHGGEVSGRAEVAGMDVREHGPGELAASVGTLLQDPETQIVMGTVRAEIAFPLENRGEPPAAVARGVEEAALALGVAALLERPTHELSGGELQRVALAAALGGRPALAVLDEPTSQLDPVAGDELLSLLRRLNEQWDTAILLADHRLDRALPAADRVIALADGAVAFDGPPPDFLAWAAEAASELLPPAAQLFADAGLRPLPAGVKAARAALRAHGLLEPGGDAGAPSAPRRRHARAKRGPKPALRLRGVWQEFPGGAAALRAVDLVVAPGERVALMGRNGAGKSTLLRVARGLLAPTRGRVELAGPMALLLQHPGDYFLRDRIGDDAPPEVLEAAGLGDRADRHPRDLSGGERQRLALALVAAGSGPGDPAPAVVGLDEPTRGMDHARRDALAAELQALAARGAAAIVATHDAELAAAFADRVILLGDGTVAADGTPAEVLAGGWYFSTETARILGGAGGALRPEQGAALLRERLSLPEEVAT
ncbi:MAG TPA: ATP-binding cassette domain-containing protein [Solirubrobacteraceae bacterium]|nr:ATP-binding cassette domain-containing protein [Solirubrobacteraceae bacterium]